MRAAGAGLISLLGSSATPMIRHLVTITPRPSYDWAPEWIRYLGAGSSGSTPSIPTAAQAGDYLVLVMPGATPTGWTTQATNLVHTRWMAVGVTAPSCAAVGQIAAFRGVDATTPVEASGLTTGTATVASITTLSRRATVLFASRVIGSDANENPTATITGATGPATTLLFANEVMVNSTTNRGLALFSGTQADAGATAAAAPTGTFYELVDASSSGALLALRPERIVRLTDHPTDLEVAGYIYKAGGQGTTYPLPKFVGRSEVAGVEIGTCSLSLLGPASYLNGIQLGVVAARRRLDGAVILVERLYMPTPGDVSLGAMHLFKGQVGEVQPSEAGVDLEIESGVAQLAVELPRFVFGENCQNILFDSRCALTAATFTVAGAVNGIDGTDGHITASTVDKPTGTTNPQGWFAGGVLTFKTTTATAALRGVSRGISKYEYDGTDKGRFWFDRPLPASPAVNGTEVFDVVPGCPGTLGACVNNTAADGPQFNNRAKFRGTPWIPKPEEGGA